MLGQIYLTEKFLFDFNRKNRTSLRDGSFYEGYLVVVVKQGDPRTGKKFSRQELEEIAFNSDRSKQ